MDRYRYRPPNKTYRLISSLYYGLNVYHQQINKILKNNEKIVANENDINDILQTF